MKYAPDAQYHWDAVALAYRQPTLERSQARWDEIQSRCPFCLGTLEDEIELDFNEWFEWGSVLLEDTPDIPSNLEMKAMSIVIAAARIEADFCKRFVEYLDGKAKKDADDKQGRQHQVGDHQ